MTFEGENMLTPYQYFPIESLFDFYHGAKRKKES